MSQQQWTQHISQRKRQEIATHVLLRNVVKPHQDQRVSEKDRIVKTGLSGHEHKTKKGPPAMFVHDGVPNFPPRRMRARSHQNWHVGVLEWWSDGRRQRPMTPIRQHAITP